MNRDWYSKKTDPNEPIAPTGSHNVGYEPSTGITKREHFSAMALQGFLSNITKISGEWTGQLTPDFMAKQSVKAADALIVELNKKDKAEEPVDD